MNSFKSDKEEIVQKFTIKEGNQFCYLMFASFNFLLFLSSLGILGCVIYLFAECKGANVISLFFLAIGLTLSMLTVCAFKLRKSMNLLCCYLMLMVAAFGIMVILTMVLFLNSSMVTSWANETYEELKKEAQAEGNSTYDDIGVYVEKFKANIENVTWALLVFTFVIAFTCLFGWCYRNSTLDRTYDRTEKLLAKKEIEKSQAEVDKAI